MTMPNAEDFLNSRGVRPAAFGKKGKGYSPVPGTTEHGVIIEPPIVVQKRRYAPGQENDKELLFWDKEKLKPQLQMVVKIQTDHKIDEEDDGIRALYISGQLRAETQKAVAAAGVKKLDVGGHIWVQFIEQTIDPDTLYKKNNSRVKYEAPVAGAAEQDAFWDATPASPQAQQNIANIPAGTGGMLGRLQQQAAERTAPVNANQSRANAGFDDEPPF